jgi:hypothetical protein
MQLLESLSLTTSGCVRTDEVVEGVCPFRTETPTRSVTPRETNTSSEVPEKVISVAVVVGIAVGCFIIGSAATFVVTCAVLARRRRGAGGWQLAHPAYTAVDDSIPDMPPPG